MTTPEPRPRTGRTTRRSARRAAGPPIVAEDVEASSPQAVPRATPTTDAFGGGAPVGQDPRADPSPSRSHAERPRRHRETFAAEQALGSLLSSRPTQLSPTMAMRAREVATPMAADLAAAGRDLVLIRRNYVPPAPLETAGRRAQRAGGGSGRSASSSTGAVGGSTGGGSTGGGGGTGSGRRGRGGRPGPKRGQDGGGKAAGSAS